MHAKFLQILLRDVLPHIFKSMNGHHDAIYPVIIGGIDLRRCVGHGRLKNDMDIKFVLRQTIHDNNDPIAIAAHDMRMRFLKAILDSPKLPSQFTSGKKTIKVDLELDEETGLRGNKMMTRARMVIIWAIYKDAITGKEIAKKELIDTGIYSNYSQEFYGLYGKQKNPIPVYWYKGIPYATCGWIYFDTVRMLVLYGTRLRNAKGDRNKRWLFTRYIKYLAKFTLLYMHLRANKNANAKEELERLGELYDVVQGVLVKSKRRLLNKYKKHVDEQEMAILQDIITTLEKHTELSTDLKRFVGV